MRPQASPSCRLYEPEAVGAIRAYAPEGMGSGIFRFRPALARRLRLNGAKADRLRSCSLSRRSLYSRSGPGISECGLRPPASPSCRPYEPEAVGAIGAYPPACKPPAYKPTGWPPARRGTILRLGEKRPRREWGMKAGEHRRGGVWKWELGMWNAE
jgi:hypothetical protein